MSHSNSSLNSFANCMARYKFSYIDNIHKDDSPHLTFGSMAHEVLYKAGKLRDEYNDGVSTDEYKTIIPSEVLFNDLKDYFGINSWERYFTPIIKKVCEYETKYVNELTNDYGSAQIEREIKLSMSETELETYGIHGIKQPLVGVIDLLIFNEKAAIIFDYKFSTKKKTQDDFDMNSQLYLYAFFVHKKYGIPLNNIQVGYIDIPKQCFDTPTLLSNGTLSRSKSQNTSQELYEKSVIAVHGDDEVYNCKPGGYYYDCWCNLALNSVAYLTLQYLDQDIYNNILNDLFDAARMIDHIVENKLPFCKKYDAYSCKSCSYLDVCKPWLGVNNE